MRKRIIKMEDLTKENINGFSVCIPIYNWNVVELVESIHKLALSSNVNFEILLMDDCSTSYKEQNRTLESLSHVRYTELEENVGRSVIRNHLADSALYDVLIFMDCDTKIISEHFIEDYLKNVQCPVVVGGYAYTSELMDEKCRLRWFYGKNREERKAADRNECPNKSFSTFNFMIRKEIFRLVKFDESLDGYGHEDTLFGWDLKQRNVIIKHIDNPVLHLSLDDSPTYLAKIENSMSNLWVVYQKIADQNNFADEIKVLKCYLRLQKLHLSFVLKLCFSLTKGIIHQNLLSSHPSLLLFDVYKLGVLNEKASR